MANRSHNITQTKKNDLSSLTNAPAYTIIAQRISQSIKANALPEGMVLIEGPLADIFGSSRSPVKKALSLLEKEGLLSRFDGRGLIVGCNKIPLRLKLTPQMLLIDENIGINAKTFAWKNYYYEFERDIILRSIFGKAKLNELALARHFGVGRTVSHDLLIHAREIGIVSKDENSRWWIVPLNEQRFKNIYDLRILLEPVALISAMDAIPFEKLENIKARLNKVQAQLPSVKGDDLDQLEEDLHIHCISYSSNREIVEALKRCHCVLVAGKHIQRALFQKNGIDPFMQEHLEIVEALQRRDAVAIGEKLIAHLELSAQKAAHRLEAFLKTHSAVDLPYIQG